MFPFNTTIPVCSVCCIYYMCILSISLEMKKKRKVHDVCLFKEFSSTSNLIVETPAACVIYGQL